MAAAGTRDTPVTLAWNAASSSAVKARLLDCLRKTTILSPSSCNGLSMGAEVLANILPECCLSLAIIGDILCRIMVMSAPLM